MSKPTPQKYKTTNWKDDNRALKARGSLTMKVLFGLALRQTQGFVHSVLALSAKKHGAEYRRQWRKVHLGIDAQTLEIRAIEVTDNSVGDAPMLAELLGQIPAGEAVRWVSGDGAYDTQGCHDAIAQRGAEAVIPTRKNAQPWKAKRPGAAACNDILRATHRRSLVETQMRGFTHLGTPVTRPVA